MIYSLFTSYPLITNSAVGFICGVLHVLLSQILGLLLRNRKIQLFSTIRNCILLGATMPLIFGGAY